MTDENSLRADFIKGHTTERELLEQLAEECSELAQASLKMIRAKGLSGNVTPVTKEEATAELWNEARDVIGVIYILLGWQALAWIMESPKMRR